MLLFLRKSGSEVRGFGFRVSGSGLTTALRVLGLRAPIILEDVVFAFSGMVLAQDKPRTRNPHDNSISFIQPPARPALL